jgi:hypothetical protein
MDHGYQRRLEQSRWF